MILRNFVLAIQSKIHASLLSKLLDFNGTLSLGLFTSASVALISHKVILIRLHEPLSAWHLILASPFLFAFDFLNLVVLYLSFQSPHSSKRILATLFASFILLLSTASASFYMETNAELNWRRTATVLPPKIYLELTGQGLDGMENPRKAVGAGKCEIHTSICHVCSTRFSGNGVPSFLDLDLSS